MFSSCVKDTLKSIQLKQKTQTQQFKVYSRGPVFQNCHPPNPLSPLNHRLTLLCQKILPHRPHAFSCQTRLPTHQLSAIHKAHSRLLVN